MVICTQQSIEFRLNSISFGKVSSCYFGLYDIFQSRLVNGKMDIGFSVKMCSKSGHIRMGFACDYDSMGYAIVPPEFYTVRNLNASSIINPDGLVHPKTIQELSVVISDWICEAYQYQSKIADRYAKIKQ